MVAGTRRDVALTAAAVAACVGLAGVLKDKGEHFGTGSSIGAAVIGASVAFVRTRPRVAWITALVGFAIVQLTSDGTMLIPYIIVIYQVFNAGRRDGSRWSLVAGLGVAVISEAASLTTHTDAAMYSFLSPGIWLAGRAARDREIVAGKLAERARELEAEREAYARLSVRYERARIAADLHDIVAHALSVMVVQAGAGQRLVGVDPELTAETFDAIASSARQAEDDMGRLVALLGDEDAIGPAPDLHLVEELVARASSNGLDVSLRLEGEREGLPAPAVQTAYRVVQESLTNALRYASGAAVRVNVRGEPEALTVEVVNGPSPADAALAGTGTGNGLRGLRERVGACGGQLDAGPTDDDGWRVAARLPRRVPATV